MLRRLLTALRRGAGDSRDLFFACCHRVNGVWRAGPAPSTRDPNTPGGSHER